MGDRWLLEHDNAGEVYTRARAGPVLLREVLGLFDNARTFYCCLSDKTDESCLWCVGEPNRRVIEGRLFQDDTIFHFVLKRRTEPDGETTSVRYGMRPRDVLKVQSSELLTADDAVAVFLEFYTRKAIPKDFEPVPKACLFGSLSAKD
jgi:hypothetical protein